jgi:hypothetical protein
VIDDTKTVVSRTPIPRHLLKQAGNGRTGSGTRAPRSTNPVKPRGRRSGKDWADFTVRDGINYGKKAWQLASHLATLINVEDKKFDVDGTSGTAISTTATVVNLSNIAQGNDYFNRSGDSILGQAVEFRAYASTNAAVPSSNMRVLVVVDRENHGADIVIGDVLQGMSSPLNAPVNAVSGDRFDILYDELVHLIAPGADLATAGTSTMYLRDYKHLPNLIRKWNKHIKYTSTAGADASNWENAMFLIAISDRASSGPYLNYSFRLHFTDN